MTVCTSLGAKSYFYITQTRRVGAVVKARFTMSDPVGGGHVRNVAHQCYGNYQQSWLIDERFLKPD